MSLKDQVAVDHIEPDEREIQLYSGDVLDLLRDEPVDFLMLHCLPGNYVGKPGFLLDKLVELGVRVWELERQPAMDFRPALPCWISQPIPDAENIGFRRIVVFEPEALRDIGAEQTWQAYQALRLFTGADSPQTLAVCVHERVEWISLVLRMHFFAAASLSARAPWSTTKLIVQSSLEDGAVREFTRLKSQYQNPDIVLDDTFEALLKAIGHECSVGVESIDYGRAAQELGLTERQYKAIHDYTGSDAFPVNGILRRHKVTDPEYAAVHAFIEAVNTGLAQLKNYSEETPVVRFFGGFSGAADIYQDGKVVRELAFTSTSKKTDFDWFWSDYKLLLRSRVGKNIQRISHIPHEEEVLFGIRMQHRLFDYHEVSEVEGLMSVCLSDQTFIESSNIRYPQL